ncbi:MAG: YceI family protein, partial [Bdellovibrionota bacterium]
MHGVTKPASFEVEYSGGDKDPWGSQRVNFSAATQVNRKDFGIVWNKKLDSGSFLLGDDVKIELEVEGTQAAASK